MGSAFRDGVDAGLSDFKSYNSDLGNISLGTDPDGFSNVVNISSRGPAIISRMKSNFERIGEKLHDDPKSWAETQKRRLLDDCNGLLTQAENLTTRAKEALEAANQAKPLRDTSDDDKKSQRDEAEQRLKEASDRLRDQISIVRNGLNEFYDTLRDVNNQFKNAIALAKNGADNTQSQVDQVLNDMRSVQDQVNGKSGDLNNLWVQRLNQDRIHTDLLAKWSDQTRAEQDADRALIEGSKKDPPLSASDLQSLARASATARQNRERAEAECSNHRVQTLRPADDAYFAKRAELSPLWEQTAALTQRRDTLMDGLNKSRTALMELNQEYQEPSL